MVTATTTLSIRVGQAVYSLFHYESLQRQGWYIPRHIFNLFHIPLHSLVCTSSCFSASQRLAGRATSLGRHSLDCSFIHSLIPIERGEQRLIHPNHRAKTMCGYDERGKLYDRTVQQQGKCSSPLNSFVLNNLHTNKLIMLHHPLLKGGFLPQLFKSK